MTGHSVLRFEYDGLGIVIEVSYKPLHGRRVLSDYADSPLKESKVIDKLKNHHFPRKVNDELTLVPLWLFSRGTTERWHPYV